MKNQNISLNEVKNSAFLANASYGNVDGDKKDDLPNLGETITNPATNSSFEVVKQKNEYTAFEKGFGFSATVFKNTETNEYVIAFRGTSISVPRDFIDNAIMEK